MTQFRNGYKYFPPKEDLDEVEVFVFNKKYDAAAIELRKYLEGFVNNVFNAANLNDEKSGNLGENIYLLNRRGFFDYATYRLLNSVRLVGNTAAHEKGKVDEREIKRVLGSLRTAVGDIEERIDKKIAGEIPEEKKAEKEKPLHSVAARPGVSTAYTEHTASVKEDNKTVRPFTGNFHNWSSEVYLDQRDEDQ